MKLLVVLRMMPDPACELELLEDSPGLDHEWLDFKLNDFDDQALEEAILLKEACGGEVIALGCGEGAGRVLQMALARGADRAIEYETEPDDMISSRVIARDVAAIAKNEGVDLVLTGVQAAEDLHGQLAPYLSAILNWPGLSGTSRVALANTGLAVSQERGGGVTAHYELTLPAVLGVQTASKAPRYVSGSKLREASKLPIATAAAEAERLEPSGELLKLARPQRDEAATSLGGTAEDAAAKFLDLIRSGAVA
ncbi:electron transfer flavoprotein subunit beta/FixA family protein [Roseovarius indicus]|uniref:Electron transfer flavoprotein small subunit n=2 Tax=Roseovarius indicus TaxID=540747 RepID=A0A5P3A973_9RHOB|nr:electron transfer flavoprotein subunit beta [Roseovarius indicus]QEW25731.1 Electron transfer flavoprotein small subunit [Roseovarius indicus]SFD99565.1 electron transfer flavoprotein beta subunit [Roseovarius indicus]